MNQFGMINVVRSISKEYGYKWKEALLLPYSTAYVMMKMTAIENKVNKKYREVLKQKGNSK